MFGRKVGGLGIRRQVGFRALISLVNVASPSVWEASVLSGSRQEIRCCSSQILEHEVAIGTTRTGGCVILW